MAKSPVRSIVSRVPCAAAAVTTRSKTPGTPLKVVRKHLRSGRAQVMLCNSGCANAATGDEGLANAVRSCELVAEHLVRAGVVDMLHPERVLPASTGVIGPQLPMAKIEAGIEDLAGRLATGPQADADAARAIMTTDLAPKHASRTLRIGGKPVALGGIAKGSGMIAPNMATMLVFLTTDAAVAPAALRGALREACAASFNRMSVDGHTSPSDMVVLLANGQAGNAEVQPGGAGEAEFREALLSLCADLAYQIVKDGEGATRVMRVNIEGARSVRDADRAGLRQISAQSKALASKAREKGLTIDEMDGASFTISNLGMFGVEHFTAIINPPNSAILAVGAAVEKPVVRGGQIVVGHEMQMTMSSDHRVIDGAMAAAYLGTVKGSLEAPATLLV